MPTAAPQGRTKDPGAIEPLSQSSDEPTYPESLAMGADMTGFDGAVVLSKRHHPVTYLVVPTQRDEA